MVDVAVIAVAVDVHVAVDVAVHVHVHVVVAAVIAAMTADMPAAVPHTCATPGSASASRPAATIAVAAMSFEIFITDCPSLFVFVLALWKRAPWRRLVFEYRSRNARTCRTCRVRSTVTAPILPLNANGARSK